MSETSDSVLDFWNHRAGLGEWAGTNDVTAKRLEMETLAGFAQDGWRIVDIGCGNGITAMELARRFDVDVTGIDFSLEMVAAATSLSAGQTFKGRVRFRVGKVPGIVDAFEPCDMAYTERAIINLATWAEQERAITEIGGLLKPGGVFLMCENSQDGLNELNGMRSQVGLPRIEPPWHNRYLIDDEIGRGNYGPLHLERIVYYSSTYYFLSRIVNAHLAALANEEPRYDSPVNQLALKLPSIGTHGQGRLWVWRRST